MSKDIIMAILRPQVTELSDDFVRTPGKHLDILMIENLPHNSKLLKELPSFVWADNDSNPKKTALHTLYQITGGENKGLKGTRAVWIPKDTKKTGTSLDVVCIPIANQDRLAAETRERSSFSAEFYGLNFVINCINSGSLMYSSQTSKVVKHIQSWLDHSAHNATLLRSVFRPGASHRILNSVVNPVYNYSLNLTRGRSHANTTQPSMGAGIRAQPSSDQMLQADEATGNLIRSAQTRMMEFEKCDKVILNPLFGSRMTLKNKVNAFLINRFWGCVRREDYETLKKLSLTQARNVEMMQSAMSGNVSRLEQLIRDGATVTYTDSNGWSLLHYAAQRGQEDMMRWLLAHGVSPASAARDGLTPLHLAACEGKPQATRILCKHPKTNLNARTLTGRTAISMCEGQNTSALKQCTKIISDAIRKQNKELIEHIEVWTMDKKTPILVKLPNYEKTTVEQLNVVLCKERKISENGEVLTLWITSENLKLQLKNDHEPVRQLRQWRQTLSHYCSDSSSSNDHPRLVWKRNATLPLHKEKQVSS